MLESTHVTSTLPRILLCVVVSGLLVTHVRTASEYHIFDVLLTMETFFSHCGHTNSGGIKYSKNGI